MKINANFRAFAGVHFDASKYIASPSMGVNRFMLDRIGSEKARATTVVQYKPDSKFPSHEHIGGEEFVVLEGTFCDQHGRFPKGTYVRNPIGSKHAPWVEGEGCTILVKLLQMADTGEPEDPLYVTFDQDASTPTEYGSVQDLHHNPTTGERVHMCWIKPNTLFPPDEYSTNGEELFLFDGSMSLPDSEDSTEEYEKWGWLRFPEGSTESRRNLKSGPNGAQVYRKTGHLTEKALSMEKIQIEDED